MGDIFPAYDFTSMMSRPVDEEKIPSVSAISSIIDWLNFWRSFTSFALRIIDWSDERTINGIELSVSRSYSLRELAVALELEPCDDVERQEPRHRDPLGSMGRNRQTNRKTVEE